MQNWKLIYVLNNIWIVRKTPEKLEVKKVHSIIVNKFIPEVSKELIEKILKDLKSSSIDTIITSTLKILPSMAIVCSDVLINNFEIFKEV